MDCVLQCVAVCVGVLQCVAVRVEREIHGLLVAVCCGVLQCVAVRCSACRERDLWSVCV